MNRGPGGNSPQGNRGPGGNTQGNNRGPGGNQMGNRAGGNTQGNNRGPGGNQNGNRAGGNQMGNHNGGNQMGNRGGGNRPGGGMANRRQPVGSRQVALKNGGNATFRKNGQVRSIQAHNMTVNRGMHGERRVMANRNGRMVVSNGRIGRNGRMVGGGYSQRAYYRNGNRVYVQRTYVYGGTTYAYAYRSYYYGGNPYYYYAPPYYYGPAYYGWAYNPWPAPVYYNWGWGGQPWYGYYGPYYQPYPAYPYASLWLTDFLISASLRAAYEESAAAAAENGEVLPPQFGQESSDVIASLGSSDPLIAASLATAYGGRSYAFAGAAAAPAKAGGGTQMSNDVKQAIADQIKKEIDAEKAAASNKGQAAKDEGPPPALDPNTRYFVVSTSLDVTTSNGDECSLTQGDVIYRTEDEPDEDKMVDAVVKASKKDECAVGATVGVETNDLQEMHNNLRQQMDLGLKELASKQGKDGIPAAPDTKTTTGEVPAPTPDSNVADDLQQTQKDAEQVETEASQQQN